MSLKVFLEKYFERISCPFVFIFTHHGWFLGRVREIVLKRNKLETQLSIP
jgi:hypothetical protein